jgi:hypothetical protein
MSSNAGQAIGQQLFRADDAPLYRRGTVVVIALACIGALLLVVQLVAYAASNKYGWGAAGSLRVAAVDLPPKERDEAADTEEGKAGGAEVMASQRFAYRV